MLFPALDKFSNWLEAEADGQVKVAVAVVKAMVSAGVPVALVIEVESVKKVAGGAHERHAAVQVGGQQGFLAVDGIGKTVTIAYARHYGDIVEPAVMEHPTVTITYHETEVTVTETVISHSIGEMFLEFGADCAHVHDHVLMTQVNTSQQRARTAFLILGKTIGCSLAVVGVVEDIIGIKAITLTFQS